MTSTGRPAQRSRIEDVLPLSPLQAGIHFHSSYDEGEHDVYTAQLVIDLTGPLDGAKLRDAADRVLERHAVLRAGYPRRADGDPVQVIRREARARWSEVVLESGVGDAAAEVARLAEEERLRHFSLDRDPLLRFTLIRTGTRHASLVLTYHHILMDGWSWPILVKDLLSLYHGEDLGPAVGYRTFLEWLGARDQSAARDAWRGALEGLAGGSRIAPVAAPIGGGRPERVECALPHDVTERLSEVARSHRLTLNTVVQGAWGILLAQQLRCHDAVFGAVVSGRAPDLDGVGEIVGLLINTVPVRVRLTPEDTLSGLFARLRDEQSRLLDHHHLDLVEIQALAGAGELFDSCVAFQNYPVDPAGLAALSTGELQVTGVEPFDAAHYPLSLTVIPADGLRLQVDYRPDVFDRAEADALLQRYARILTAVATDPQQRVAELDTLSAAERRLVLVDWNDTARPEEFKEAVERVRATAEQRPDATAVSDADGEVSYRTLMGRVDALSRRLRGAGVADGELVAVLSEPTAAVPTALLGILGAGAAYVPLDPEAPVARTADLLAAGGVRRLLAAPDRRQRADELAARLGGALDVLPLDSDSDGDGDLGAVKHRGGQDALAYVCFTSGSTGKPKGAMVHRRGMNNHLLAKIEDMKLGPADSVVMNAPLTFDISVWQMLAPLLVGGRVHMVDRDIARDPAALFEVVARQQISVVETVPSFVRAAVDLWSAGVQPPPLPRLRWFMVNGEVLPPELCERWYERYPAAALINAYGLTECSDDNTHAFIGPDIASQVEHGRLPVGRPLRNNRLYILNERLAPVPPGVPGDLFIAGTGVGPGYLRDPRRTAERYVPDPFSGEPGARMYRTGDLARLRADGQLDFLGRQDHQVKVRGNRIELGEVETATRSVPGVNEAVVSVDSDGSGQQRLLCHVTGTATPEEIRGALAELLPAYMVPSLFLHLDALPLTVNGKLDRKALPKPRSAHRRELRRPATEREQAVCAIFAAVLGLPEAGLDDDFFVHGGHSLLAAQLISRVRTELGAELSIRDLFSLPTPAGLVERIGQSATPVRPALRPRRRTEVKG